MFSCTTSWTSWWCSSTTNCTPGGQHCQFTRFRDLHHLHHLSPSHPPHWMICCTSPAPQPCLPGGEFRWTHVFPVSFRNGSRPNDFLQAAHWYSQVNVFSWSFSTGLLGGGLAICRRSTACPGVTTELSKSALHLTFPHRQRTSLLRLSPPGVDTQVVKPSPLWLLNWAPQCTHNSSVLMPSAPEMLHQSLPSWKVLHSPDERKRKASRWSAGAVAG